MRIREGLEKDPQIWRRTRGGLEKGSRRIRGSLRDWRMSGEGFENDWRRAGGGSEDRRKIGEGLEEDWVELNEDWRRTG